MSAVAPRPARAVAAATLALSLFGCGAGRGEFSLAPSEMAPTRLAVTTPEAAKAPSADAAVVAQRNEAQGGPSQDPTSATLQPRKIVYNANVSLVVETMNGLAERVAKLVADSGGYISSSDESSQRLQQRQATWTARVPVEKFDGFLAEVARLGELQQHRVDSQDVTQEFYDVEARIKNKQEEEKRLLNHLADSTGKLEDILAVERELSRVRGEIEQMQGRIRYLANITSLSTVTITALEIHNYVPPADPTFATEVARTFRQSAEGLGAFLQGVVLAAVAIAPWLPVLVVGGLVLAVGLRIAKRAVFSRLGWRIELRPPAQ